MTRLKIWLSAALVVFGLSGFAQANDKSTEVVFVDSAIAESQKLAQQVRPGVDVILLDARADGLSAMRETLLGRKGLDAVHVISHGTPGRVMLGSGTLSADSMDKYGETLKALGSALREGGELKLYGCEVGAGLQGQSFVSGLAKATGSRVMASSNVTGNAAKGGDWTLETSSDSSKSNGRPVFAALGGVPEFSGLLPAPAWTKTVNQVLVTNLDYPYPTRAGIVLSNGDILLPVTGAEDADYYLVGSNGALKQKVLIASLFGRVNDPGDWENYFPSHGAAIAAFDNGGFVVAYSDRNGEPDGYADVFYRIFNNDLSPVGASVQIVDDPAHFQGYCNVATSVDPVSGDRLFAINWIDQTAAQSIDMAIFKKNGTVVKPTFRLDRSVDPAQTQYNYSLAGLADGGFVATYNFYSNDYLMAQRFDKAGNSVASNIPINIAGQQISGGGNVPHTIGLPGGGWATTMQVEPTSYADRKDILVFFNSSNARLVQHDMATVGNSNNDPTISVLTDGSVLLSYTDNDYTANLGYSQHPPYCLTARYTEAGAVIDAPSQTYFEPVHTGMGYDSSWGYAFALPTGGMALWWSHYNATSYVGDSIFQVWAPVSNSAPTDLELSANTVVESAGVGTVVGALLTTDPDAGNTFTYSLVSGAGSADNAKFTIDGAALKVNDALDYEASGGGYLVRVRTTDQGGLTYEEQFGIFVTNANETPTAVSLSADEVQENSISGTTIGNLTTTDPDSGDTFTYSLASGGDNDFFTIAGDVLKTNAVFDFETKTSYSITVRSTDAGGLFYDKALTVTVTNVNEVPTDISLTGGSVAENVAGLKSVGTFSAVDPDTGDTFTYSLVTGTGDDDNGLFSLDGNELQTVATFNFETKASYSILVQAEDALGLTYAKQFTVNVTDANDLPVITGLGDTSTDEDMVKGPLGFTVTDEDGDTVTVSGSSDDQTLLPDANVEISGGGTNFLVTMNPAANKNGVAAVTITANDGTGDSTTTFNLTVNPINDAPTNVLLSANTVAENASSGTTVGTLSSTDADAGDTHSYTLVTGTGDTDNGSFTIVGNALKTAAMFDYETKASYSVRVQTVDSSGATFFKAFAISVTDENDPPTISDIGNQTTAEDTAKGPINFTVGDQDNAAASLVVTATSDNQSVLADGDITFGGGGASRNMILVPAADANGTATVTVTVFDGTASTSDTFVLTVTPVNDAPTIVDIDPQVTDEDVALGPVAFTVGDVDGDNLTINVMSWNTALLPLANISIGGAGDNRTITMTPAPNQYGDVTVTVLVLDGKLTSLTSFDLTVNPVNDAPTVSAIDDVITDEDVATGDIAFTVGDLETAPGSLVVSATSDDQTLIPDANVTFGGSGASRTVKVTPAANKFGTANVTVTVGDGEASVTEVFQVTVNPVNDLPTFAVIPNITIDEDSTEVTVNLTIDDIDGDALTSGVSDNNPTLVPWESVVDPVYPGQKYIKFTPAPNQSGTVVLGVMFYDYWASAEDNTGTFRTFQVTVNPLNDAPTISAIGDQTIDEETSAGPLAFTVGDVDNDVATLTVTATSNNQAVLPNANIVLGGTGANRTVTATPALNKTGTVTVTVTVEDAAGLQTTETFDLAINPLNDAPTIVASVTELSGYEDTTATFNVTIADVDNTLNAGSLSLTSSNETLFNHNNVSITSLGAGVYSLTLTPESNQNGTTDIVVTVTDGALSATASLTYTVIFINNTPTISNIVNTSTKEDTLKGPIAFTVGDPDNAATDLVVSATSSNESVLPNTGITIGGAGANRTISMMPAPNAFGSAVVTVTVTDGNTSAQDTFTLTVTAVNDAPTISDITNQTTSEDSTLGPISFTLTDIDGDTLTVSPMSWDESILPASGIVVSGTNFNRTITLTPAANANGTVTVSIMVFDGKAAVTDTFEFEVTPVNDAPTIAAISAQSTDEDTPSGAIAITVGDIDSNVNGLVLTAQTDNASILDAGFASFGGAGANRTVVVTPKANANGLAVVTVKVSDGELNSETSFDLTVNAVSDAPTFSSSAVTAAQNDVAYTYNITTADVDVGDIVSVTIDNTPSWLVFTPGSNGTAVLSGTPITSDLGDYAVVLTATDSYNNTSTQSFTITVGSGPYDLAATPEFSPVAGTFDNNQTVAITSTTPDAVIKYTLDGSLPTKTNGMLYTAPVAVGNGQILANNTATLKAVAYVNGAYSVSLPADGDYEFVTATPVVSPAAGTWGVGQTITMTCATAGAKIYFTLDGSDPAVDHGTKYTSPFALTTTATVKAIAVYGNYADSDIAQTDYTILPLAQTPQFSLSTAVFVYTNDQVLEITSATDGAEIRYTTDGSIPTATTGTVYAGPIAMSGSATVKAVAYKAGEFYTSGIGWATYNFKVGQPTIMPITGTYGLGQLVDLTSVTNDCEIYYTLDGSTPSKTNGVKYLAPFAINTTGSVTVKTKGFKAGYSDSNLMTRTFNILPIAQTPTFDQVGGLYSNDLTVALSSGTTGATIRYTTDGSAPSVTAGNIYAGALTVAKDTTIKAVAYLPDAYWVSSEGSVSYTFKVATPVIVPVTGTYGDDQKATITCATTGASIYYTNDGSDPNPGNGTLYSASFNIGASSTIKAAAFKTDYAASDVVSETYNILPVAQAPVFSIAPAQYTSEQVIELTSGTPGAIIRYTLDDTIPTTTHGTVYTVPFNLNVRSLKIKAVAYVPDEYFISPVTAGTFGLKVGQPSFTPVAGTYVKNTLVSISSVTTGADFYYTTNGTTPSKTNGTHYTGPFALANTGTVTVKAIGYKTNYSESNVWSNVYVVTNTRAATPVFNAPAGVYPNTQTVAITSSTVGAVIRYTLDGSVPTQKTGTIYSSPITVSSASTIKAISYKPNSYGESVLASASYSFKVAAPEFVMPAGTYATAQPVAISTQTAGPVTIKYTLDGTTPSEVNGIEYTGALTVDKNTTIKAIAFKGAYADSDVSTASYTIINYHDDLTGMDFIWVPAGSFVMGDTFNAGLSGERPTHVVTLTNGFYLGKTEVTQEQYEDITGVNPSFFTPANEFDACPTCPVESVSHIDVQNYVTLLNGLGTKVYKLPTEAQWEYAAKGGDVSEGFKYAGTDLDNLGDFAWYRNNAFGLTQPVGIKFANELGLHDMSGNVMEWVADWYGPYTSDAVEDPAGPDAGVYKVAKGGSYVYGESQMRTSYRSSKDPAFAHESFGFRLIIEP